MKTLVLICLVVAGVTGQTPIPEPTKKSCRVVHYHVQRLHQINTASNCNSSNKNKEIEDLKAVIAAKERASEVVKKEFAGKLQLLETQIKLEGMNRKLEVHYVQEQLKHLHQSNAASNNSCSDKDKENENLKAVIATKERKIEDLKAKIAAKDRASENVKKEFAGKLQLLETQIKLEVQEQLNQAFRYINDTINKDREEIRKKQDTTEEKMMEYIKPVLANITNHHKNSKKEAEEELEDIKESLSEVRKTIQFHHPRAFTNQSLLIKDDEKEADTNQSLPKAVSCGKPGILSHGRITGDVFTYGSVVTYQCDTGYRLIGESSRMCQANGAWSSTEPTCEEER